MIENKIKPTHLARTALVYVRQSTATQLERNPESTDRQYQLVERALELGWRREQISVIDEDLGRSGSGLVERSGFDKMTSALALGQVGIIIGLEVSRLARNNADWYRMLDLAGLTDTLIADGDGVYHAGLFNDRLVLGLKGTMSEAELHVIRARLDGGIRNKAARGELRCSLPIGFVWGDLAGEIKLHPNEAVLGAIRSVFERFAAMGSARQVWLWFRAGGLSFPMQLKGSREICWVTPRYSQIWHVLTNPVYAGAYIFGRKRSEHYVDSTGRIKSRMRHLSPDQWQVTIQDHHAGIIDWQTYENNLARLACNGRPQAREAGGAVREGAALLQGIATCGRCGRRLHVYYNGRNSSPGYYCGQFVTQSKSQWCLRVGGCQIDEAVAKVFLDAMKPAGVEAALMAEASIEADHDAALAQWRLEVERARYEAQRAERQYRAVEPENRLVARGLEAAWEKSLRKLSEAEAKLACQERKRPRLLTDKERERLRELGADLGKVWSAPTTTDRDRKELLRTVLEDVIIALERKESKAHLTLRWRGGAVTDVSLELKRRSRQPIRTDEDTIELVRRLASHYPDEMIASILNRQGRRTSHDDRFTADKVGGLRRYWKIPRFEPKLSAVEGELVTIEKAADILGVASSTVHRWLAEGFIAGEQLTPGAPWRIRITEQVLQRLVEDEIDGYVPMTAAIKLLGVTRQTIMDRIKHGDIDAIHVRHGKQKGLRIKVSGDSHSSSIQLNILDDTIVANIGQCGSSHRQELHEEVKST